MGGIRRAPRYRRGGPASACHRATSICHRSQKEAVRSLPLCASCLPGLVLFDTSSAKCRRARLGVVVSVFLLLSALWPCAAVFVSSPPLTRSTERSLTLSPALGSGTCKDSEQKHTAHHRKEGLEVGGARVGLVCGEGGMGDGGGGEGHMRWRAPFAPGPDPCTRTSRGSFEGSPTRPPRISPASSS